jgi:hypothetical protein
MSDQPAVKITGAVVAACPMGGFIYVFTQDGSIYRVLPTPLDVVLIYPPPVVAGQRDEALEDRTFDFRRAAQPG